MAIPCWSYSGMKNFGTCPKKFHAEKVLKLYPFSENKYTRYGKEVHTAAEDYIGANKDLAPGYEQFRKMLDVLKNKPGEHLCELKMALTADKVPCSFKDKNAMCRGIADLVIINGDTAYVVDYKTGSARYPDKDQLELMALMLFEHYPDVNTVYGGLLFMVHNKLIKGIYRRAKKVGMWSKWHARDKQLQQCYASDVWNSSPNGLCKAWCPVDQCVHNGRNA